MNDMIEPSPELAKSAEQFIAQCSADYYANLPPYEGILRQRSMRSDRPGFDSDQHFQDVIYLLRLLDRERR